ncbi:MAG: GspE/PulE family protein [Tissierellia bacterium]|nr:GspE/PulE family protein [Tissierellia bacterium]
MISKNVKEKFSIRYCKKNMVVPVEEKEDSITYLAAKEDLLLAYNLEQLTGKETFFIKRTAPEILDKINEYFSQDHEMDLLYQLERDYRVGEKDHQVQNVDEDSPVVKILDHIVNNSIEKGASDIHIEILEDHILVRHRIDGFLIELLTLPLRIYSYLVTRIKIISKLDIAEKRIPQDGQFQQDYKGRKIDIRVAITPTSYGEKIVFRILDIIRVDYTPKGIGLYGENLAQVTNLIRQPTGLILCCGPTSSGKTSTLYTILQQLNRRDINIMTIEDPVEYKISGINQIEVNEQTGLTFEKGLKAILRMDPDKIMIGEIRNRQTAQISITSSITGHLVLSTLHTENSPAAIYRLIDMGIQPFLVSAGLIGVISQRLIRKLCPHCKIGYEEILPGETKASFIYKGLGCSHCHQGYVGRKAVFEIMLIDADLKEMISQNAPLRELQQKAIQKGMKTLEHEILNCIKRGETSMEEYYNNILTVGVL